MTEFVTSPGEFSVVQFFPDESWERAVEFVDAASAMRLVTMLVASAGAEVGIPGRIIITDGGDFTVFEWTYLQGVVFPTREQREQAERAK